MAEEVDAEAVAELRDMLGEPIPEGGTETDTLFTDAQLGKWVINYTNLDYAAVKGWQVKMAHFADLVDVTDGASSRKLGDLLNHAERMIIMHRKQALGPVAGRTRVGKIRRP